MSKILGFDQNMVFATIIVLILVILGVISFHYYAFATAGDKSALSAGFGAGIKLMPYKEHLEGQGIRSEAQNVLQNARESYCRDNKCTHAHCPIRCKLAGCPCK